MIIIVIILLIKKLFIRTTILILTSRLLLSLSPKCAWEFHSIDIFSLPRALFYRIKHAVTRTYNYTTILYNNSDENGEKILFGEFHSKPGEPHSLSDLGVCFTNAERSNSANKKPNAPLC